MSYAIPKDLPLVSATWEDWPLPERIRATLYRIDAPVWAKLSAVAIAMIEQPGKVPCGNCCGIMAQGNGEFPWGWKADTWKIRPIGYVLLNEGQGIKGAPFLAFARVDDSLSFLIDRCYGRKIRTGDEYASEWVGMDATNIRFEPTVKAYEAVYDRVIDGLWKMLSNYGEKGTYD